MTYAYQIITLAIIVMSFGSMSAHSDDSITHTQLQEVEIRGERKWISSDGTVNFVPTKKEKRLSNSPGSLINSMHIPILKSKGDRIENISGEDATIFINGEKAEAIDIAAFWPNEVKTVQYMENPKDPKFEGAKHVVNFIMKRYAAGGVCRTNVIQKIPNYGLYSSSAKLTYGKMTFGAMLQGIYSREHRSSSKGKTVYSDLYYKGDHYDEIERTEESRTYDRTDIINCALNAKYNGTDFNATHTLSLGWVRNPGSGSLSTDIWTDNLFKSNISSSENTSRSLSPQISGNYYKRFSDKWHLAWRWDYMHTADYMHSTSTTGETPTITNGSKEKINTARIFAVPSLILSQKIYFQMSLTTRLDWFTTVYSGSAKMTQRQRRSQSSAALTFGGNPKNRLSIYLQPGVGLTRWDIGDIHEHSIYPTATAGITWIPSRKLSVNGTLLFASTPPSAAESNPALLRSSEILWTEGNPYLKHQSDWDAYVNTSFIPTDNLSFMLGLGYDRSVSPIISSYEAAGPELEGLMMRSVNASPSEGLRAVLPVSWTCPDNSLSLKVTPQWRFSHVIDGPYKCRFSYVSFSANADYTLGNCRFGISYDGPNKSIGLAGMEKSWTQDRWNLDFTYGTENLYVSVGMENIFHDRARKRRQYSSAYLASSQSMLETGRRLSINLTYTFGFGRRTDQSIDISGPETVSSSVFNKK